MWSKKKSNCFSQNLLCYSNKETRIYSEMDLLVNDAELRDRISNYLLSENRVAKKINGFNGYVGYVEKGSMINYYNPNIKSSLNIQR